MIIVIMGPTGVGKTKLSISLAKKYNADIINCDAVQVYEGLDIGSAKVTKEEMEGVPHLLFDIKKPTDEYSVSDYQKDVRNILNNSNKNYILVGGTGLYACAALMDYRFLKDVSDADLSKYSIEELRDMALNKDSNCQIDFNNRLRLERFIKKDINDIVEPKLLYDNVFFIGLTTKRENLYRIINDRVDIMFDLGLIEEVKNLYEKYPDSKILNRAIGYKEVISYLKGDISLEDAKELIKKNSRHYAKRQYTWFNNKMDLNWFDVHYEDFSVTIKEVEDFIACK